MKGTYGRQRGDISNLSLFLGSHSLASQRCLVFFFFEKSLIVCKVADDLLSSRGFEMKRDRER